MKLTSVQVGLLHRAYPSVTSEGLHDNYPKLLPDGTYIPKDGQEQAVALILSDKDWELKAEMAASMSILQLTYEDRISKLESQVAMLIGEKT